MLQFTSCAVPIHDEQFCSPHPDAHLVFCDNFLTSNQLVLSEAEWVSLQQKWISEGKAIECTTSTTVGDIKAEIEKLCSVYPCDYSTQTLLLEGLTKVKALGEKKALP